MEALLLWPGLLTVALAIWIAGDKIADAINNSKAEDGKCK